MVLLAHLKCGYINFFKLWSKGTHKCETFHRELANLEDSSSAIVGTLVYQKPLFCQVRCRWLIWNHSLTITPSNSHFTEEGTEVCRGSETCRRPGSRRAEELYFSSLPSHRRFPGHDLTRPPRDLTQSVLFPSGA